MEYIIATLHFQRRSKYLLRKTHKESTHIAGFLHQLVWGMCRLEAYFKWAKLYQGRGIILSLFQWDPTILAYHIGYIMATFEGVCQIIMMESGKNCSWTGIEKERGAGYLKSQNSLMYHFFMLEKTISLQWNLRLYVVVLFISKI